MSGINIRSKNIFPERTKQSNALDSMVKYWYFVLRRHLRGCF